MRENDHERLFPTQIFRTLTSQKVDVSKSGS